MVDINDPALLDGIRNGEKEAIDVVTLHLKRIISSHLRKMRMYSRIMANEFLFDTLSEVALAKKPIPGNVLPLKYLTGIAYHLIARHIESRKKHPLAGYEHTEENNSPPQDDSLIRQWEIYQAITTCLSLLSDGDRKLIELLLQEKTPGEIIDTNNYKGKGSYYTRKKQACDKFRALLREHGLNIKAKKKDETDRNRR